MVILMNFNQTSLWHGLVCILTSRDAIPDLPRLVLSLATVTALIRFTLSKSRDNHDMVTIMK